MFYFLYCSIDRKYEYFCTTGNKNCKCIFLKSIFFKLADGISHVLVEILRVRLWARKLIFLCHRILNSSTLRLLCRGHSFDLCWELLALVIASCDCSPNDDDQRRKKSVSGNVPRKKDVYSKSKRIFISKFISYFSVFIIVLVFQYLVFNSLYHFFQYLVFYTIFVFGIQYFTLFLYLLFRFQFSALF